MERTVLFAAIIAATALAGCGSEVSTTAPPAGSGTKMESMVEEPEPAAETQNRGGNDVEKVVKTDEEWRETLTPEQYRVLREKGTEPAFSGDYWKTKTPGVYVCAACGRELFDSDEKYDSGTGWPSYWKPIDDKAVDSETDRSLGMTRTEVLCSRCGGHLGHVFEDGPPPTGLRYCINSAALRLVPENEKKE